MPGSALRLADDNVNYVAASASILLQKLKQSVERLCLFLRAASDASPASGGPLDGTVLIKSNTSDKERSGAVSALAQGGIRVTGLLELTAGRPTRKLDEGEVLLAQGDSGGDLYILLSGALEVVRDGVVIATLDLPGTLIGEMSVLLHTRHSATVRAAKDSSVRVVRDALQLLDSEPEVARRVASLLAGRLDATSAMLVDISKTNESRSNMFSRLFAALHSAGKA